MTNVKSLLALYLKMGGSLTDTYSDIAGGIPVGQYSLISDAILACSKKYSSGGGSYTLPTASADTKGGVKIGSGLTMTGEVLSTTGGGAEKFVVTLTEENDTWTADKTIAEIFEAYDAGANVVCSYPVKGGSYELPCIFAAEIGEAPTTFNAAMFSSTFFTEGIEAAAVMGYENEGSDGWIAIQTPIEALPSHTSANNGQVLGVSSGDLAWVDNYAPLIVTLTAGQEAGTFVGDKTYKEAYDAFIAGRNVVFYAPDAGGFAETVKAAEHPTNYALNTDTFICEGSANDYITNTVGG